MVLAQIPHSILRDEVTEDPAILGSYCGVLSWILRAAIPSNAPRQIYRAFTSLVSALSVAEEWPKTPNPQSQSRNPI